MEWESERKYIIHETNTIGRIYNAYTNNLIFKGEFLNNKKNGKGEEYYPNGKLKYEGEYLNGKRNGKGIEYDLERNITYEKEYKNGKLWNMKVYDKSNSIENELKKGKGIIKEYRYGSLIYQSQYLNGEINGIVKKFFDNRVLKFEQNYLNGIKHGKGKEYYINGKLEFEGEYFNGNRWNGKGKEYNNNGKLIFEGEYLNGEKIKKTQ